MWDVTKKGVWAILPILDDLPNTIMQYIIFSITVSKLYSLYYPADDANVLQSILCSVLIKVPTYQSFITLWNSCEFDI